VLAVPLAKGLRIFGLEKYATDASNTLHRHLLDAAKTEISVLFYA
jgi:hypothetical protein